jgi:nucleoside-diphosphate-sugar epimerase
MKILITGGAGYVGSACLRRLVEAGHEVVGTTRSPAKAEGLGAEGVEPVVLDAFDAEALRRAIADARPEVVVNELTALSGPLNPRRYGEWIADTNRLRRDIGPVVAEAAHAAGARRVVAQSIAFMTAPEGPPVVDEDARLYTDAPGALGEAARACAALEDSVTRTEGIEGIVLRYGFLYGPGTGYARDGDISEQVRRRRYPIVGSGDARFSFVHVEDAAAATVAALDGGRPSVLNVTDDEPAPMREWIPELARVLGAPRPLRVPALIARLAAGPFAVYYGTKLRGAWNAKAKRIMRFAPRRLEWLVG